MTKIWPYEINKFYCEDCIEAMKKIPDWVFDLMVTSPPYNIDINYGNEQRKWKIVKSKGVKYKDKMEEQEYRKFMHKIIQESIRTLKDTWSIYFNIKNRYIDWEIIPPFWIIDLFEPMFLKNIIIWSFDWWWSTEKRFNSRYEYVFMFTKNKDNRTFNLNDVKIPSVNYRPDRYKSQLKNPSDVWKIPLVSWNSSERTNHPAQYPEKLIERIIKVATNQWDLVFDPFVGSGTTGIVAQKLGRNFLGFDNNNDYIKLAEKRFLDNQK